MPGRRRGDDNARRGTDLSRDIEEVLAQVLQETGSPITPLAENPQVLQGITPEQLIKSFLRDRPEEEPLEELERSRRSIEEMLSSARELVEPFLRDGVLRALHPIHSRTIINTRLDVVANALADEIDRAYAAVASAVTSGEGYEEVYKRVARLHRLIKLAKWVVVAAYDYMIHHLFVSGPGRARPPLANTLLGYDIV